MLMFDLTGKEFGKWIVLEKSQTRSDRTLWECVCKCGAISDVYSEHLRSGRSMGCKKCATVTHGMSGSPEWKVWLSMKSRCLNKNHTAYKRYGGRGITICDEWIASFDAFYRDVGDRPKNHTLDRIDNSKGYSKENCRWATAKTQANNSSFNRIVMHQGEKLTVAQLSEKLGVKYPSLDSRLVKGTQPGAAFL